MDQPGPHGRHRDRNGELSKKHGNTLVRTLRKVYGEHFAEGCSPEERLSDVLQKMDEPSLSRLVHDHEHHKPMQARRIAWAAVRYACPATLGTDPFASRGTEPPFKLPSQPGVGWSVAAVFCKKPLRRFSRNL